MKRYISAILTIVILLIPVLVYAQESTKTPGPATPKVTIVSSRGNSVVPRDIELSSLKPSQKVKVFSKQGDSVTSKDVELVSNVRSAQDKQALPYDQAPEAKTTVQPKYPDLATKAGIEGTVWTKVFIDETGKVTKVTISKSDAEILNKPSIDAAMQWAFKPAMKDGKPIATEVAIPFRYKMQGDGGPTDYTQPGKSSILISVRQGSGYRVTQQQPYLLGQSPTVSNEWYPESAQKDKFEGLVMLKLNVNLYGRVDRVEVEGHAREDLDSAAVRLARTWTFIPGQSNGMPEKTIIRVPLFFSSSRPQK
jgi:TonB family protein